MSNIIDSIQLSGVTYTISGQSSGGGKAIEAGRGIDIATGATADTVSISLPISAGTGNYSIQEGQNTRAIGNYGSHAEGSNTIASGQTSHAEGYATRALGENSHAEGDGTKANGEACHAEGTYTQAIGSYSHAEGVSTKANGIYSHTEGANTIANNTAEHASGRYNNSVSGSSTFGDSGNTLFSVGNGTSSSARHNAFEIRQNGDIYLSSGGTDIKLQDHLGGGGGGGNPTVELTQAEYDALVSAGTVSADTYYIITDAQGGDLSNYYTKNETNTLLGGKADTATTYTKTEVDNAITAATSTKQDTLVSGTNIKTINNTSLLGSGNIDIQGGGGGGKAIEAGRGIAITTGETADTVSFNLPISADSNTYINAGVGNTNNSTELNILIGSGNTAYNGNAATVTGGTAIGFGNEVGYSGRANFSKSYSFAFGYGNKIQGGHSYAIGNGNNIGKGTYNSKDNSFLIGYYNTCTFNGDSSGDYIFGNYCTVSKSDEFALGKYNVSNTGSTDADRTFFSIGNGTRDNARHNAFEIRQNGDIYLTKDGQDVKLQDQLGGGGASYSAGTGIDITNNVISVSGVVETSAITTTITSSSTDAQVPSAKAVYDIVGDIETLLSQI